MAKRLRYLPKKRYSPDLTFFAGGSVGFLGGASTDMPYLKSPSRSLNTAFHAMELSATIRTGSRTFLPKGKNPFTLFGRCFCCRFLPCVTKRLSQEGRCPPCRGLTFLEPLRQRDQFGIAPFGSPYHPAIFQDLHHSAGRAAPERLHPVTGHERSRFTQGLHRRDHGLPIQNPRDVMRHG